MQHWIIWSCAILGFLLFWQFFMCQKKCCHLSWEPPVQMLVWHSTGVKNLISGSCEICSIYSFLFFKNYGMSENRNILWNLRYLLVVQNKSITVIIMRKKVDFGGEATQYGISSKWWMCGKSYALFSSLTRVLLLGQLVGMSITCIGMRTKIINSRKYLIYHISYQNVSASYVGFFMRLGPRAWPIHYKKNRQH